MEKNISVEIKAEERNEIAKIKKQAKEAIKKVKQQTLQTLASVDTIYAHKLEIQKQREREAAIPKRYSLGEEIFNSISHGVGAGLSIAGLALLIVRAVYFAPRTGIGFYITGFTVFGVTLIILYLMSTLYHALTLYHVKKVFGIFDHSSIYLLISGTYTPFCLGALRQQGGWWLFGLIWGFAIIGITLYAVFGSKMRLFSGITYVIMGWLIVFARKLLTASVPLITMQFLLAGGVAYTVGIIFYALKKLKWTHCIWHLFVLAGSILHFFSIYYSIG